MMLVTDSLIREMAEEIVQTVDPAKIILFGSHVGGNPGKDSDVDFLIIEDKPLGRGGLHRM